MSQFYLELNAIIHSGKKLLKIIQGKHIIYTSSWAISEQLINVNENTFQIIKSSLFNLYRSKIIIDWDDPYTKRFSSFGMQNPSLPISSILQNLYVSLLKESNYSSFHDKHSIELAQLKVMRSISEKHTSLLNKMKEMFSNASLKQPSKEFMNREIFELILKSVCRGTLINPTILEPQYNGQMERYCNACANFTLQRHFDRNDSFDLLHFSYLSNKIVYMVSNDNNVSKLDDNYNHCSVDTFLKKVLP